MSATCLLSNIAHDVRCPVCGQGFLLFAEHVSATVRQQVRRSAEAVMRLHHAQPADLLHVHPADAFDVGAEDTTMGGRFNGSLQMELVGAAC